MTLIVVTVELIKHKKTTKPYLGYKSQNHLILQYLSVI